MGLAENQQIALQVADLLTAGDVRGPLCDASLGRDLAAPRLAAEALPAPSLGTQQVTMELEGAALGSIDELVDRLVALAPVLGVAQTQVRLRHPPATCGALPKPALAS